MANSNEKKTNVQVLNEIRNYLAECEGTEEWVTFLDGRIELMVNQAAKSKARKAAKAAEKPEDEMLAAVQAQLGDKLITVNEIVDALTPEFPEVTKAKVVNRLTRLVKSGVAGKMQVSVGEGKRLMAYALAEYMPSDEEE